MKRLSLIVLLFCCYVKWTEEKPLLRKYLKNTTPNTLTVDETERFIIPNDTYPFKFNSTQDLTLTDLDYEINSANSSAEVFLGNDVEKSSVGIIVERTPSFAATCNVPLGSNSKMWKSNHIHMVDFPIKIKKNSSESVSTSDIVSCHDCLMTTMGWETKIEIQMGDTVMVKINDSELIQYDGIQDESVNYGTDIDLSVPGIEIYQTTSEERVSCNFTNGMLLDVIPIKVDNNQVITLYENDLVEGTNHLVISSKLWVGKCVGIEIRMKTDTCGENQNCNGNGVCYTNDTLDFYECQCCLGYVGFDCKYYDPCYPNPCQNNGVCESTEERMDEIIYKCHCTRGFDGETCETALDPCESMPCLNGATCVNDHGHFLCQCLPGFVGPLCEENTNSCKFSPCIHGDCVSMQDGYSCFCHPGYTGPKCRQKFYECHSSPCQNGGDCVVLEDSVLCTCPIGYSGANCEIKVSPCDSNPCKADRKCIDKGLSYECECLPGFIGADCSEAPPYVECRINICANGGTCWEYDSQFFCFCETGFTGPRCAEKINYPEVREVKKDGFALPITQKIEHYDRIYYFVVSLSSTLIIVWVVVHYFRYISSEHFKKHVEPRYQLWIGRARALRASRLNLGRRQATVQAAVQAANDLVDGACCTLGGRSECSWTSSGSTESLEVRNFDVKRFGRVIAVSDDMQQRGVILVRAVGKGEHLQRWLHSRDLDEKHSSKWFPSPTEESPDSAYRSVSNVSDINNMPALEIQEFEDSPRKSKWFLKIDGESSDSAVFEMQTIQSDSD